MSTHMYLRIPDELHARIKGLAERERRSINAQVIWLLEQATTEEEQP